MADSTIGQLANYATSVPIGLFLKYSGNEDYSRGGRSSPSKLVKGQNYHISGTTKNSGVAVSREVYLVDAENPNIILEKIITSSDGLFDFKFLEPGTYTVYAVNPDGTQDNVIHANIEAVVM